MPLVITDEAFGTHIPGVPGGAASGVWEFQNAPPYVFVIDDIDVAGDWGWSSAPLCASNTVGSLTLVYNDTLARVELTGAGIDPFTDVLVERSTDQIHWTTVRGGSSVDIVAGGFTLNDYEFEPCVTNYYRFTTLAPVGCATSAVASVTPILTHVWFKSVTRPFLNIPITIGCVAMGASSTEMLVDPSGVSRPARSGVFPIINRTYPIAVNDLRLGREWNVRLRTFNTLALKAVDFLLASGDVILIQVPSPCVACAETVEHGYVTVFDAGYQRHHRYRQRAVWELAVQEVAPPGPDIIYAEATWQTVINQYGSWSAVLAAFASWQALLAILPQPSEVIVP